MFYDEYKFDALYQAIRNNEELTKEQKEYIKTTLQDLKEIYSKINETKEEIENSSFSVLKKNNQLFDKSTYILQKIQNLSNLLNKEKVTFDSEIKKKFDDLANELQFSTNSLIFQISNKLNNLDSINKEYEKKLEKSLNSFKNRIDEYNKEIAEKTFLQRWGAVFTSFGVGVIITIAIIFYFFKNDIIFSLKYSDICNINKKNQQCYVVPAKKAYFSNDNNYIIIQKK